MIDGCINLLNFLVSIIASSYSSLTIIYISFKYREL